MMGMPSEDVVVVQQGKNADEPYVITVNCPDKTGLGSDLCRIIFEFGLSITKADVSTDGKWCYVILWVVPPLRSMRVRWSSLKERLLSICPSCLIPFYFDSATLPKPSQVYLLKFLSVNRKGLLHDVTQVLSDLELTIHRVKVSTMPDGRVDTCERLNTVLEESCLSCELQLAGQEYEGFQQGFSCLPPAVAEELFSSKLSDDESCLQALTPELTQLKKAKISMDNSLSPSHTLLQIHCVDQKSLLYDITRTLKDFNIKISYSRFSSNKNGCREVDLFIQQMDGKKILDPEKQSVLSSSLKMEILHPLRVVITSRGPDTELLVANPVELSGKGRPRVFYDVTVSLKMLGICIFLAEIWRHSTSNRAWEVYRFLLDENCEFPLANSNTRTQIVDRVRRTLMGW
ncbi:ACT domain-containing protein ACR9 isoform X2 [Cinnamomum micranthum f. kanehirae]|uniref:ACT domain-containing protein ACR n=1 Tax=Cinnamomum micranthum f. kanehirae TaxID=337451 RepID=A0A3S3MXV4_9MAGN|nr:ACT domain-containing protein ACR9 isoform X2 [Cinnamomum micranthum f. kanehirae]